MRRHAVISEVKRRVSEQHRAVPRSCVHCVAACRTVTPCLPRYGESPLAIRNLIWKAHAGGACSSSSYPLPVTLTTATGTVDYKLQRKVHTAQQSADCR